MYRLECAQNTLRSFYWSTNEIKKEMLCISVQLLHSKRKHVIKSYNAKSWTQYWRACVRLFVRVHKRKRDAHLIRIFFFS